jgi:hypothetical protein
MSPAQRNPAITSTMSHDQTRRGTNEAVMNENVASDYKGIVVTLDRESGTNDERSAERYAKVIEALKPFKDRGLRVRIAVAASTFEAAGYRLQDDK